MELVTLPLDDLGGHPQNSNVMPAALFDKLKAHLAERDEYPPVIVRPYGSLYQILDGHHRVEALRQLGRDTARCVVWRVDDAQALVLLATLNRLEGQDDPRKRAALIDKLKDHVDLGTLAQRLPEHRGQLDKLAQLHETSQPPRAPRALDDMPVAIHFFLLPAQRRAVEQRLRDVGGPRESALLSLLGVEA